MSAGDFFLDTNILIYAFNTDAPDKRKIATELIEKAREGKGCISFQVIQEFIQIAKRKFSPEIPYEELRLLVQNVLLSLCKVLPSPQFYLDSMDTQYLTKISWFDALILQAAVDSQCETLYSEDLQHGFRHRGVTIINPFKVA